MTHNTLRRRTLTAALALTTLAGVAACSSTQPGQLGQDQQIAAHCPASGKLASYVLVDGTGSARSAKIEKINLQAITRVVRETAICSGRLTVSGFGSSSGDAVSIYDGELDATKPTENATLRAADKLTEQVMQQITAAYDPALNSLIQSGTDVNGLLPLIAQQKAQLARYTLHVVLLTDGLTNIDVDPTAAASTETAKTLADLVPVPDLSGVTVTIAGIGREAVGEIPSTVVANVTAYWERICERSKATSCTVVTDWR